MERTAGNRVIVFAGTSEGRLLYEFCVNQGIRAIFCVATEYGRQVLGENHSSRQEIRAGRMDTAEMLTLFREEKPVLIIDATHPYAREVTENIRETAEAYRQERQIQNKVYYRVLRSLSETEGDFADIVYCEDMRQAAAYLDVTEGNILVTTGSRQLAELCKLKEYADRAYLRILPNPDILRECLDKGFRPDHICCMQGPFSMEMNVVMLQEYNIRYLLTKQSGRAGGYPQKVMAAQKCGVKLVVITPPQEADGVSVEEMKEIVADIE